MFLLPFLAALPLDDQALATVRMATAVGIVAPIESDRWSNTLLLGRVAAEQMDNWWAAEGMILIAAAVDPVMVSPFALAVADARIDLRVQITEVTAP